MSLVDTPSPIATQTVEPLPVKPQSVASQPVASQSVAPQSVEPSTTTSPAASSALRGPSAQEEQRTARSEHVNRLRAGVLGANDGIVSVAGLAVGVAGATTDTRWLLIAGLAALIAGALSMAMGEYVSVSTQRDTDRALIARTRADLAAQPEREHRHLVEALTETGIPQDVVGSVAESLERHDALGAHTRFRHNVEDGAVVSPWGAAITSLISFSIGGAIPLLAILASPAVLRLPVTMLAVVVSLAALGVVSARLGQATAGRATLRTIAGGLLAIVVTYGIGAALGAFIA
ncbi:MAG: VIT1/CCC1 transporter family protein [Brachybacterium tyrofermentans]|uniref:VIT1/CCC1 transporter family protein n=1 Tax=Brachybacterium tyrofermentans TaxID=47848 RepID=UPI0018666D7C|nr:VIT family protein [Brachybacterium tyrofermentans]